MGQRRSVGSLRHRLWPVVLGVLFAATACSNANGPPSGGAQGADQAAVRNLASIADLQRQFNRDDGLTRLVLLVSPT